MRKPRLLVIELLQNRGQDTADLIGFLRSSHCYEVMELFAGKRQPARERQCHFAWARQVGMLHAADAVVLGKIETASGGRSKIAATLLECASGLRIMEFEATSISNLARQLTRPKAVRKIRRTATQTLVGLITEVNNQEVMATVACHTGFFPHDLIKIDRILEEIQDPCAPWATLGYLSETLGKGIVLALGNGWMKIRYLGCRLLEPGYQIKTTKF